MTEIATFNPIFSNPPVVETRLAVQFEPLGGFESAHFGLFWQECLGLENWLPLTDQPAANREFEQFGYSRLRPSQPQTGTGIVLPNVRFRRSDKMRTVQLQSDRFTYGWNREEGKRPSYAVARPEFDAAYQKFEAFCDERMSLKPELNLWQITYVNAIPQGTLWGRLTDWHGVLPGLFSDKSSASTSLEWATFDGTWYFALPNELGRVRVRVQKAVRGVSDDVVLLVVLRAQGEIGPTRSPDWATGMSSGHEAITRLFCDLISARAKEEWGFEQ